MERIGRGRPSLVMEVRCESVSEGHSEEVMEYWQAVCRDASYLLALQVTNSMASVVDRMAQEQ